jgi:hypothetical protein
VPHPFVEPTDPAMPAKVVTFLTSPSSPARCREEAGTMEKEKESWGCWPKDESLFSSTNNFESPTKRCGTEEGEELGSMVRVSRGTSEVWKCVWAQLGFVQAMVSCLLLLLSTIDQPSRDKSDTNPTTDTDSSSHLDMSTPSPMPGAPSVLEERNRVPEE